MFELRREQRASLRVALQQAYALVGRGCGDTPVRVEGIHVNAQTLIALPTSGRGIKPSVEGSDLWVLA